MPFNLHYYFLYSIAAAGRLQTFNRDLQNIQVYYRSKRSLHSSSGLLPFLKTSLFMLLLQPGTRITELSFVQMHQLWTLGRRYLGLQSSNSQPNCFWDGVSRHTAVVCPQAHTVSLPGLCLAHLPTSISSSLGQSTHCSLKQEVPKMWSDSL